jgi:hypothetical protein
MHLFLMESLQSIETPTMLLLLPVLGRKFPTALITLLQLNVVWHKQEPSG